MLSVWRLTKLSTKLTISAQIFIHACFWILWNLVWLVVWLAKRPIYYYVNKNATLEKQYLTYDTFIHWRIFLFQFSFNVFRVFVFIMFSFHVHDLRLNTCKKLFTHSPVVVNQLRNIHMIVWCNWTKHNHLYLTLFCLKNH